MGRNVLPVMDLFAVLMVILIRSQEHVLILHRRLPAEFALDLARIKDKGGRDHVVLIYAQRRYAEVIAKLHHELRKSGWKMRKLGFGS